MSETIMYNELNPKDPNKLAWVILGLITLVVAVTIYFFQKQQTKIIPVDQAISPVVYSAVFLTNGQVYFGKLSEGTDFEDLTQVHYLNQNNSTNQPELVHMGNELHQPTDEMKIFKSQILFTENLASTSPVTQAINNSK